MRRHLTPYLLGLSFVLAVTPNARAQEDPSFTTIDFPGAVFTEAWGINPRGDIVGLYRFADNTPTLPRPKPLGSTRAATSWEGTGVPACPCLSAA